MRRNRPAQFAAGCLSVRHSAELIQQCVVALIQHLCACVCLRVQIAVNNMGGADENEKVDEFINTAIEWFLDESAPTVHTLRANGRIDSRGGQL